MRKGLYYSFISMFLFHNQSLIGSEPVALSEENAFEMQLSEDIDGLTTIIPVFEKERAIKISKPYFKIYPNYTEHLIGRAMVYFPIIEKALNKYNLPEDLKYLPFFESGFQPDVVSSAGATGLWQFMRSTATNNGLTVNAEIDERLDYQKSSEAAARYLKSLYDEFQDWALTLMAYNAGPYRLKRVLRSVDPENTLEIMQRMPRETRTYLSKLIAAKLIFTTYQNHQIVPEIPSPEELHLKTVIVDKGFSLHSLAANNQVSAFELASLNPHIKQNTVSNSRKASLNIRIPYTVKDDQEHENAFEKITHYFSDPATLHSVAQKLEIDARSILLVNEYFHTQDFQHGLLTFSVPKEKYMEIMQIIGPEVMPKIANKFLPVQYNHLYVNKVKEKQHQQQNKTLATVEYFLQPKETLLDVAQKFNISLEKLIKLNPHLTQQVVQVIRVPASNNDWVHL